MRLTLPNGDLTLPKDFSFEIEKNSPFFSEDGTGSLPITIPTTPENLSLLGFPNRTGKGYRFDKSFDAILSHGPCQIAGTLIIDTVTSDGDITGVLSSDESAFYGQWQDKTLKEILEGHVVSLTSTKTTPFIASNGEDGLVDHLWDLYTRYEGLPAPLDGFAIFPVCTSDGYDTCMLNIPDESASRFVSEARTIKDGNGVDVSVPERYGVTPFVYLWKLLEKLFECCGFEIEDNAFKKEDSIFSYIVILNNCADSITPFRTDFKWSDLVPSITLGELIVWLHDKFGAGVFIKGHKAYISLIQHSITDEPDKDLSEWLQDGITIKYPAQSRVVLKYDTSIEGAAPPCDTLADFVSRFTAPDDTVGYSDAEGLHFNIVSGTYYIVQDGTRTVLGSNAFQYDRKNSEDSESISCNDRFVPMGTCNGMTIPNVGGRIHLNSSVNMKQEQSDMPILVCWAGIENGHYIGTSQGKASDGTDAAAVPAMTPEGMYPHCWQAYNEMKLNGVPELTAHLELPASVLMTLDLRHPKLLNGQKVLIKSLSYSVGDKGLKCRECTLQLLHQYADRITDLAPAFLDCKWKYVNDLESRLRKLCQPEVLACTELYTEADIPGYAPAYAGMRAKQRKGYAAVQHYYKHLFRTDMLPFDEYYISVNAE